MTEHQSSRTLVKSAPELWAECSDAASLARHLGAFGEIRITKLEPETTVAWEGAAASGTVKLETSGWGTRVTLTIKEEEPAEPEPRPQPEAAVEPEPEPEAAVEPEPESIPIAAEATPRRGMFTRFRLFRRKPSPLVEPELSEPVAVAVAEAEPAREPQPAPIDAAPPEPEAMSEPEPLPEPPRLTGEDALVAALDSLGMAHHRPYSRA
jgi:hypothetical protein